MILAPSLWTPSESRHGAWWRRARKFGASIAAFAGHLKYAGEHLTYTPTTGHLVYCPPVCPCVSCIEGTTPATILVTFANVVLSTVCRVATPGKSTKILTGALDGTYCLTPSGDVATSELANAAGQFDSECCYFEYKEDPATTLTIEAYAASATCTGTDIGASAVFRIGALFFPNAASGILIAMNATIYTSDSGTRAKLFSGDSAADIDNAIPYDCGDPYSEGNIFTDFVSSGNSGHSGTADATPNAC